MQRGEIERDQPRDAGGDQSEAAPDPPLRRPGEKGKQQAERELAGATARVGAATANLFPRNAVVGALIDA